MANLSIHHNTSTNVYTQSNLRKLNRKTSEIWSVTNLKPFKLHYRRDESFLENTA